MKAVLNRESQSIQQPELIKGKDDFSSRLDKALNEFESLQNAFATYKAGSTSRPQTPQINFVSPNDSRFINYNQKLINTPSSVHVIQEFKNVFQEAENTLRNNANNPNDSFHYHSSKINETNFTNTNLANAIEKNDNVECLKVSNQILNKSNLDLKNLNKLLKIELSSYKNSLGAGGCIPLTQYDTNTTIYIDTLKTALNTSQMSNIELNEILNRAKDQNEKIMRENDNFKVQVEQFAKENENNSALKQNFETLNTNLLQKCNELSNENLQIQSEIENVENQIMNQKEKNETLQNLIDNFSKTDQDMKDILANLRTAIDDLKVKNDQGSKINEEINVQIERYNGEVENKNSEIGLLSSKIEYLKNEVEKMKETNRALLSKLKEKEDDLSKQHFTIKKLSSDIDIMNNNTKTLLLCANDKNKTIQNLKESLNVLQGTESFGGNQDTNKDELIQKRKRLADIIIDTNDMTAKINELKKSYIDTIRMKDEKIKILSK